MDTSDLVIVYSEGDFAQAIRTLLPKGEYWQENENAVLTNTIEGIAADFKVTHDDIELSLLTEFSDSLFGWKLKDYQILLNESGSVGVVSDDIHHPNLITIDLLTYDNDKAFAAFEKKRLPHTEFVWLYSLQAETQFNENTALIITPEFNSELALSANTQSICSTAISWQLEIGENQ